MNSTRTSKQLPIPASGFDDPQDLLDVTFDA